MDGKKFDRIIRNPRHISGVHNYCDGWCDRCAFTLRCAVYAAQVEMEKDRPPHQRKKEELWPRLEAAGVLAAGLLAENLGHAGVGLAKDPIFKMPGRPLSTHRIGAAAKRYMEFAHRFVQQHQQAIGEMPVSPQMHDVTAGEAFEVVAFYCLFIGAKVARALSRRGAGEEAETNPLPGGAPRDEDGSAKVALIAIDRSILAWAVLQLHVPAVRETALSGMLTLHRLRGALERAFPAARGFVRPGFDTHRFPERGGKAPGL